MTTTSVEIDTLIETLLRLERDNADSDARMPVIRRLVDHGLPALGRITELVAQWWWDEWSRGLSTVVRAVRDPAAIPLLTVALDAENQMLSHDAATALGTIPDGRALVVLLTALNDTARSSDQRWCIADVLGDRGDPLATASLKTTVAQGVETGSEADVVVIAAAKALAKLGDFSGYPTVLRACGGDSWLRRHAVSAMELVVGPGMVDYLETALHDPASDVRFAALCAVARTGTRRGVDLIVPLAEDPDADVAAAAIHQVGRLIGVDLDLGLESCAERLPAREDVERVWREIRSRFQPGVCHRFGRPVRLTDLVHEAAGADRITGDLQLMTGLPLRNAYQAGGWAQLRAIVDDRRYPDGVLHVWGHPVDVASLSPEA